MRTPPTCRPARSLVCVSLSLATAPRSPALISGTLVWVLPCSSTRWPRRSRRVLGGVVDGRIGLERPGDHAEHRDAAGERIGDGLPHERRRRARIGRREPSSSSRPACDRALRRRRHVVRACASSSGWMPMLAVADAQSAGKMRPAATPRFSPPTSSSCVSVPASKNFSISESSASATISISASRALLRRVGEVGGDRALGRFAAAVRRIGPRLHRHQIDDAAERFFLADRQLNRDDRAAEHRPQRLERALQAGALTIEPVQHHQPRHARAPRPPPRPSRSEPRRRPPHRRPPARRRPRAARRARRSGSWPFPACR